MDINTILKKYQDMLKLNDWNIEIIEDESLEITAAETYMILNDYKAIMKVKKSLSNEEKEKAIIHELLHSIFRDAYDIFDETVENEFAKTYCKRQHERAIEKTAKIIYSLVSR